MPLTFTFLEIGPSLFWPPATERDSNARPETGSQSHCILNKRVYAVKLHIHINTYTYISLAHNQDSLVRGMP